MPWGAQGAASVSDLVQRLQRNDAQLSELHVMRTRRLDDAAYRVRFDARMPLLVAALADQFASLLLWLSPRASL